MRGSKSTYSPEIAELFFKRLAQVGQVKIVCQRLGIHPTTPHDWKRDHPEFAKRWEEFKKA